MKPPKLTTSQHRAKWKRISKARRDRKQLEVEVKQPPTGPKYPVRRITS